MSTLGEDTTNKPPAAEEASPAEGANTSAEKDDKPAEGSLSGGSMFIPRDPNAAQPTPGVAGPPIVSTKPS